MRAFRDKVAIVTGAASGIGKALSEQLASHGATVVLTDVNESLLAQTTNAISGKVSSAVVDVTDAAAVKKCVDDTVASEGRIDYIFNNAGIAIICEVADMSLDDWYRILDINLRGVVHGIHAAYPIMIEQGFGHIVNTASVAGLAPAPTFTAYTATKHAVVGLSRALRAEAKSHGVNVSVLCPGFIDTSIAQNATVVGFDRDKLTTENPFKFYTADYCAKHALKGVAKNKQDIVITVHGKNMYRMQRFFPGLVEFIGSKQVSTARKKMKR